MQRSQTLGRIAALALATVTVGAFAQSSTTTTTTNKSETTATVPAVKVTPPSVTVGNTASTTTVKQHAATHHADGAATKHTNVTSKTSVAKDGDTATSTTAVTTSK